MPSIVWKGQLTFGLVSVPVKLYRAARRERVQLHYVHSAAPVQQPPTQEPEDLPDEEFAPPPSEAATAARRVRYEPAEPMEQEEPEASPVAPVSRVRQTLVSSADEQPVRRSEMLRGYELERDRYVVFEPQELRKLQRRTSPTMEIKLPLMGKVRSVRLQEIEPVFLQTSYYVGRTKAAKGIGDSVCGIASEQSRSAGARGHALTRARRHHPRRPARDHRPQMFYVDEVRFENEYQTDTSAVSEKELDLAGAFLKALEAPFAPEEFNDIYREELQAMIGYERRPQLDGVQSDPVPGQGGQDHSNH